MTVDSKMTDDIIEEIETQKRRTKIDLVSNPSQGREFIENILMKHLEEKKSKYESGMFLSNFVMKNR